jgi:cytochrome P450
VSLIWRPGSTALDHADRGAVAILEQLMTPAERADPFPLYAAAHLLGPVSPLADGSFLVCGYAAVNQVLRDPGFGQAEPVSLHSRGDALQLMNRSILRANPPEHGRMRSLIAKVFTPAGSPICDPRSRRRSTPCSTSSLRHPAAGRSTSWTASPSRCRSP